MYRCSTGNPASLLLLLGVLLSGFAQAESGTDLPRAEPLLQSTDWLALQHDMYLFDINNNGSVLSLKRVAAGNRLDAEYTHVQVSGTVGNAPELRESPPAPSALWILGASLIGLAAVSRRRTQPALAPA